MGEALLLEALTAYERPCGMQGVVAGYRQMQTLLQKDRPGDRLAAWADSLGLDAAQQAWLERLWEVFRTARMVEELDERLPGMSRRWWGVGCRAFWRVVVEFGDVAV